MFDITRLLDEPYKPLAFGLDPMIAPTDGCKPTEMNWADPFRPDDILPDHVKKAMVNSMNTIGAHYTYPIGDAALRHAVATHVRKVDGLSVDGDLNITISPGSDNLFAFAMRPFLTPGEQNEVLMPVPSYAHNFVVPTLIGGKPVIVPTRPENGFDLDIGEFEKRVTSKTKIIVITNPNNPTGTVYTHETLERLADFVIRHNLILVVDQAFRDTYYDGNPMTCAAALPNMFERTITFESLSKGMGMCGLRTAYIIASEPITKVFHNTAVFFLGAPNTIAQAGALAALENNGFQEKFRREFQERAEILEQLIDTIPHVTYIKPQGGFYFWLDTSYYGNDAEVVDYLVKEANVLVSGGSMCGDPSHIRIIFGVLEEREQVIDAVKRIRDALIRHPKNQ